MVPFSNDPGRPARRHATARRLLSGLRDEPRSGSPHPRPPPARLGRHNAARVAVFVVSGIGADAEAAGTACFAAGEAI
jgi:hypothetical protein